MILKQSNLGPLLEGKKVKEKRLIIKEHSLESEPRFTFTWDKSCKDVKTVDIKRAIRSTINSKRMVVDNFDTLPFGHQ